VPDFTGRETGGAGPRCIALIGPQGAGKSTLLDAMLVAAGEAAPRRRDPSQRETGTELRLLHANFMGDPWAIIDCPGSVEFAHEVACALAVADLAVIVCEPAPERAATVGPALRAAERAGVPAMLFVNKLDLLGEGQVRDSLAALQGQSHRKLVLRQVPIREGGAITGYVDLVSERAYRYRRGAASERIEMPEAVRAREAEARGELLEALADHDDALMEKVLEDLVPSPEEIYRPLHEGEAHGQVVSVLLGAAEHAGGIQRLWKALRHDVPDPTATRERLAIEAAGEPCAQVFRTLHAGHAGRLSYARIWRGPVKEGASLGGIRVGGLHRFPGGEAQKLPQAEAGEVVALARMEGARTGDTLGGERLPFPAPPPPVHAVAVVLEDRKDEVRLSAALQRLTEEDTALLLQHDAEMGQMVLSGQGDLHLRAALERLSQASGVKLRTVRPQVAYRETIRQPVTQHARLKRQTGGHGQFADVKLEIAPRARGEGFLFTDRIVGGVVPKRFIPAVGEAAAEATRKGPLGHPVVDVAVTLVDGTFHAVDSSDMAFASATRLAMQEGLAKADPVLLEPIDQVTISVPAEYTPAAQRLLGARRGQILGFAAKEGWDGWDEVQALVPEAELHELIIELRSLTLGLGSYTRRFDHLAESRAQR
jgi:elongation factor G